VKLSYDPNADALYLRLNPVAVVESEEVRPGVVLDFDARGEVVGVEILSVKKRLPEGAPRQWEVEVDAA